MIFGKHIDKLKEDRGKVHTLPVLLGDRPARMATLGLLLLQYGLVVYLVMTRAVTPVALLVLLALPSLRRCLRTYAKPAPETRPAGFPAERWPLWFVAHAFDHNRRFGALYLLALFADAMIAVNR